MCVHVCACADGHVHPHVNRDTGQQTPTPYHCSPYKIHVRKYTFTKANIQNQSGHSKYTLWGTRHRSVIRAIPRMTRGGLWNATITLLHLQRSNWLEAPVSPYSRLGGYY